MAKERLSMRKTKEILRLKLACGLSNRQIASSCHVSRPTVGEYLARARIADLVGWPDIEKMPEEELENLLFPAPADHQGRSARPLPDYVHIHEELRRHKHVTRMLLWQEYKQTHPDGYGYVQFVNYYKAYKKKLDLVMRQEHKAGEKVFVDYSGGKPHIVNPDTGEVIPVELFVAVWGASNYTYAEATMTQELPAWVGSHVRALEYFQAVPQIMVPDNLKSGVTKACRYEPDLNPTYQDLAGHYGFAVIPTRAMHPRDKAKVEVGVQVAQRWILASLRHRTFFSLADLNRAIRELLEKLNTRAMKKIKKSRREVFETLDKPAAKSLPEKPYEYAQWKKAKVNIDYHIEVDSHYYSVPFQLAGQTVDVKLTAHAVEVLSGGKRTASHARSFEKFKPTTNKEHMPEDHQRYAEWTPSRIINWAGKTGPKTAELVQRILQSKDHPEQGYRSSLGIIRLEHSFGPKRLEAACQRALAFKSYSYKRVRMILERGLDRLPLQADGDLGQPQLPFHENIRGSAYFQNEEGNA